MATWTQTRIGHVEADPSHNRAGKTTRTRGIGEALHTEGIVSSPTCVIARTHPLPDSKSLVHVDAYRLGSASEVDDLDLDLAGAVTVVEWGAGRVEHLADSRLEITLAPEGDGREAIVAGHGPRWDEATLAQLISPGPEGESS